MSAGEGHLALLVEDDRDTATALTEVLRSRGDRVRAVGTVEEGLAVLAADDVCYCVFDQQLPADGRSRALVGGGERLVSEARKKDDRRNVAGWHTLPILVVTGYSRDPEFISERHDFGADAVMGKPVDDDKLLAKVRTILERAGRVDHRACAALAAKAPPIPTSQPPTRGGVRLVIDGRNEGARSSVVINDERRTAPAASFLMLLRLASAHAARRGTWVTRGDLQIRDSRGATNRVRQVFKGLVPEGFQVVDADWHGSFRLNEDIEVLIDWQALGQHPDERVRKIVAERGRSR